MASSKTPSSQRPGAPPDRDGARTNGAAHQQRLPLSLAAGDGTVMVFDDPLNKVLGLDAQTSGVGAWIRYYILALLLLFLLSVSAQTVTRLLAATNVVVAAPPQEIDVVVDEPPPPPPPPVEPEAKPEPAAVPRAAPREVTPAPPAAAPAQAAKVLTQEPDPNEPVDLTGDTIVTGNADSYAGGITASNGTGSKAVRGLAGPTAPAAQAPAAAPPPPPGPDRSHKASIGAKEWNVPFPAEADTAQIDEAYVTLQMDIQSDGTVSAVRILSDPGNGFGREARRYALTLKIPPATDHDGNPIASTVTTKVHFTR
jgi:periplasmic protein TonB